VRERLAMLSVATRLLARDPSGQTGAEYLGVLLVVAAIIVAIVATDPGQAISDKLSEIVRDIAGER
jgi:Flp pilus assembly pilin Flp